MSKHKSRRLGVAGDSSWKLEVTGCRELVVEIDQAFARTGFKEDLAALIRKHSNVPVGATHLKKPCGCPEASE